MSADIKNFRLPRFNEVPDLGLYLDQTVKYINGALAPLACIEVTPSMVSNYVKKKYISKPDHKLYSRQQITSLIFIAIAKLVLSMDNISLFLRNGYFVPGDPEIYNDFCDRFEDMLRLVFYNDALSWEIDTSRSEEPDRLALSLLVAVSHYIYLNDHLDSMQAEA